MYALAGREHREQDLGAPSLFCFGKFALRWFGSYSKVFQTYNTDMKPGEPSFA